MAYRLSRENKLMTGREMPVYAGIKILKNVVLEFRLYKTKISCN